MLRELCPQKTDRFSQLAHAVSLSPLPNRIQYDERVVAGDDGVRRVVIDGEPGRIDRLNDLQENVQVLRELRVAPVTIRTRPVITCVIRESSV